MSEGLSRAGDLSRIVPEFHAGVVLCMLRRRLRAMPPISGLAGLACVAAGLALGSDPLIVAALGLVVLALSFDTDWLARLLSPAWLRHGGELSYSAYMVQRFAQDLLGSLRRSHPLLSAPPALVQFAMLLCLVFALAAVMHHLAEIPARRILRRRLSGRPGLARPQQTA
ncbi:MAG: hypothetical protein VB138_13170 [Burkholderia sp.]